MKKLVKRKKIKYNFKHQKARLIKESVFTSYQQHQAIVNNTVKNAKKDYGIFFTPEHVVNMMVNLINTSKFAPKKEITILEPACGLAQFLVGIKRNKLSIFNKSKVWGVEINKEIINYHNNLDIKEGITLINDDYLLWQPDIKFDLIIGNPPYGIPSLSEHYTIKIDSETKQKYKNIYETWYGKYNVYGAFIEKSVKLLKPEGQLIFIVPPTFMILDEFKKLRTFLADTGSSAIIYLGAEVFKPEADVSSVILNFHKTKDCRNYFELLKFNDNKLNFVSRNTNWHGEIIKFRTKYSNLLDTTCSYKLKNIYEIKISPRTPEIKHNPEIIASRNNSNNGFIPILNGRNLKRNEINYDNLSGFLIKKSALENFRGYFKTPHIVVGLGFRGNGYVGAAYDEKCFPWMGDVYHLSNKTDLFYSDFNLNKESLLKYLSSDYIKKYINDVYRDITYHLSITQLNNLPIPSKEEWDLIKTWEKK